MHILKCSRDTKTEHGALSITSVLIIIMTKHIIQNEMAGFHLKSFAITFFKHLA